MYQHFFGFKEKPFTLVPNPAYLFLSRIHEEALAYLTYAVSQGDGFVQITGEVGTGKTTLCRAFLENLDDRTEAAYIFNPKLDALQLLRSINEEFGIASAADNTKDLIDALNRFLIAEKAKGKNIVLLIDEAQNLSFDVLEQIRLLSNLETTRSKLIQIILVGQPELEEMLNSPKLRQLGQRITLSCSLLPLTYAETDHYIRHRLNIASRRPAMKFPRAAVQAIYRYSKGIPRLINIACDRTLLTAFGLNRHRITAKIARSALKELTGNRKPVSTRLFEGNRGVLVFSALCLGLIIMVRYPPSLMELTAAFHPNSEVLRPQAVVPIKIPPRPPSALVQVHSPSADITAPAIDTEADWVEETPPGNPLFSANEIAPATDPAPMPDSFTPLLMSTPATFPEPTDVKPGIVIVEDLGDWLPAMRDLTTRNDALKTVLGAWKTDATLLPYLETIEDNQAFFRMAARHNGFLCQTVTGGDLRLIKKLNLPAVIELSVPDGSTTAYLTISKMDDESATLNPGGRAPIVASLDRIRPYWTGFAAVPWKNFFSCTGEIPTNAPQESIITLKMMLKDMGFPDIRLDGNYDEPARKAIRTIQAKHGILADGVVGPFTKIVLYNEHGAFPIPHIRPKEMEPL